MTFKNEKYLLMDVGKGYHSFKADKDNNYMFKVDGTSILTRYPREWGYDITLYNDKQVISMENNDESISYFIREDVYDEYKTAMDEYNTGVESAEYNIYTFHSFQRHMDGGADYSVKERIGYTVYIDENIAEIINKANSAPEDDLISYEELHVKDEDHLIIKLMGYNEEFNIFGSDCAALIKDIDKYYICNSNWHDEKNTYPLSLSDSITIERLFENYPNAIEINHSL